jgi:hypothetical protein
MSPAVQTVIALALVAVAAALLVRGALKRRRHPGCGSTGACGAVSPEVRRLQEKIRRDG